MRITLYILILCLALNSCFKDKDVLLEHTNVLDKDYDGESPFVIKDPNYYTFITYNSQGVPTTHYRISFIVEVKTEMLPKDFVPRIVCEGASVILISTNPNEWNRFQATKVVDPGGGTYCQNIYLVDELGYFGKRFNHCVTATG